MDPMIEGNLDWAPLTRDDLPEIAALIEACDYIDDPVDRIGLDELADLADEVGAELSANGVVGRDRAGTVIAWALLVIRGADGDDPRGWLHFNVHPTARHRTISHKLVEWMCDRTLEWRVDHGVEHSIWLGAFVDAKLVRRADSLTAAGLEPERWYVDMHLSFDDVQPGPVMPPDGVQLVPFDGSLSEPVRQVHNQAFSTLAGSHQVGEQEWQASLAASTARPQWSHVALEGDQVVGYALNSAHQMDWEAQGYTEGWTDRIGVRPDRRGRGIGRALVEASLNTFSAQGLAGAGLGLDTTNHETALVMFTELGYTEADSVVLYGRTFA